ncbi:hypothetical protein RND71_025243 [Anisodus tanguticus]|uniref:NB-ARC domain-containing protein n=1 Tax=Anisodus tanguticus TaxID=243964 RepID=A0AAE1V5L9_9SOLA|nr:hypothetical protein RND71_025243 [Anisodus tanguticus]
MVLQMLKLATKLCNNHEEVPLDDDADLVGIENRKSLLLDWVLSDDPDWKLLCLVGARGFLMLKEILKSMITPENDQSRRAIEAMDSNMLAQFIQQVFESSTRKAFSGSLLCPPSLVQVSKDIIEKCTGLPVVILVIAGALATKGNRTDAWEMFYDNLFDKLQGSHSEVEHMRRRHMKVEEGAMPFLEELQGRNCRLMEELSFGIEHLSKLQYLLLEEISGKL